MYSSPLVRARSTAAPIAAALEVPLILEPGLAEYAIGILENETFADLAARHRFFEQADADLAWAPPGGESLGAVGARVVAAWRAIARQHPAAEVVVVSHGAAIATGLAVLLHEDPRAWLRYRFRNTSVNPAAARHLPAAPCRRDAALRLDSKTRGVLPAAACSRKPRGPLIVAPPAGGRAAAVCASRQEGANVRYWAICQPGSANRPFEFTIDTCEVNCADPMLQKPKSHIFHKRTFDGMARYTDRTGKGTRS